MFQRPHQPQDASQSREAPPLEDGGEVATRVAIHAMRSGQAHRWRRRLLLVASLLAAVSRDVEAFGNVRHVIRAPTASHVVRPARSSLIRTAPRSNDAAFTSSSLFQMTEKLCCIFAIPRSEVDHRGSVVVGSQAAVDVLAGYNGGKEPIKV